MKVMIYQLFAWIGRSMYNCRGWLEQVQDWADSHADRWNQDNSK